MPFSFPPGCKTAWKASNMMKYGVEEWSGQKERCVLKLQDQRGPRAVCHPSFLPGPLSYYWTGGCLPWTTMNTTAAPPAVGKLQGMENQSFVLPAGLTCPHLEPHLTC